MLTKLAINNIALIEAVELDFNDGLNVLTGETGAGKSILIDAMNLALGARSDKELIKSGCNEARVEMAFDTNGLASVREALAEMEMESGDEVLIISRQMNINGRNTCRINGIMATLAQLKRLTALLIDIHGQHEHQSLLNESRHMDVLDGFGGEELLARRALAAEAYGQYHKLSRTIKTLFGTAQERARRVDVLRYQTSEIKAANLVVGEEEELAAQLKLLQHAEEINNAIRLAYEGLYAGGERGAAALDSAGIAAHELGRIEQYGEEFRALKTRLETVIIEVEDIAQELRARTGAWEFDGNSLNDIESRMDAIRQLKRKYGNSIAAILQIYDDMAKELYALDNADEQMEDMAAELQKQEKRLLELSLQLTAMRKAAAERFSTLVEGQLSDLGMKHARFAVEFEERQGTVEELATAKGFDRLRFAISPNPGEPMKPLARIASGGEMSRIMLALKNIAADADSISTLIFDEIDTGISGNMARVVAEKLAQIALGHQVICVTHSAQIAAMGGSHFFIEKSTDGQSTRTMVTALDDSHRVAEIARLVGGEVSSLSGEHAAQMLQWSGRFRAGIAGKANGITECL